MQVRRVKVDAWYRIESVERSADTTGALAAQEARVRKALSPNGAEVHCPPSSYQMYDIDTSETIDRSPQAAAAYIRSVSPCRVCRGATPGGLGYCGTDGTWREVCKKCAQTALRIFEDDQAPKVPLTQE